VVTDAATVSIRLIMRWLLSTEKGT
jgi:hypothetical protein